VRAGKREAQRVLNEMITEAERGLAVRRNATVGELLEAWFEMASGDFSPSTVKETRGFINRNLLPTLGAVPLSKLRASELDAFYRRLQASGGSGGRPLSPATVRRIHGILRRALGQGVKWGWMGVNPAASTSPPRVSQPEIKPPSSEALGRVLRRAADESPSWRATCSSPLPRVLAARRWWRCAGATWHSIRESCRSSAAWCSGPTAWSRRTPRPTLYAALPSTQEPWRRSTLTGR
jgi:hypothetical protein